MKTTKQVLTDARDMALIPGKLSKGMLVRVYDNHGTTCYCALGLIARASGYRVSEPNYAGVRHFNGLEKYADLDDNPAVMALASTIETHSNTVWHNAAPSTIVYKYNDASSIGAMIAMFNKAIEQAGN